MLAALAALCFVPGAQAQLEQFGIQNSNRDAQSQQQLEREQNSSATEGTCTDPAGCSQGAAVSGGQAGSGRAGQFTFDQGPRDNYYQQPVGRVSTPVPQQPSEFQRYVGETTGIWLNVFGTDLFRNVPNTFAPVINAPVTPDYTVGPGDEVIVQAWGQIDFDIHQIVDRSGQITIPHVGAIRVAGLKFSQLQDYLKQAVGKNFRNFDLNVNLGQLRSIQVFVTGQARRPGSYTISSLSTLVNAIFATGGPSANGSMRHVQLRRDGKVITDFDLYDLLLRGDSTKDVALLPGDVIFIPGVGPQVAIFGSVDRPAIYEMRDADTPAADMLKLAGGVTVLASDHRAELERSDNGSARHVVEIGLDSTGLATPLRNGDILRVYSMVPRFDNAITLRGNVANPGRYAWHEGMHIRDIIPDRESLVTRQYWRDRARLGLPVVEFTPATVTNPEADTRQTYEQTVVSGNAAARETSQVAQIAQGRVETEQEQQRQRQQQLQNGLANNAANGGANNVDGAPGYANGLGATGQQQNSSLPNRAGPTSTSESSIGSTAPTTGGSLAGNQAASEYAPPLPQNFPAKNIVEMPAPQIDWSYAVIERMDKQTLRTRLIPFDLGRLVLDGDASQDQVLEPGDVITVFSQADIRVPRQQQARLVRIEGEVKNAGTYSVEPGETLRQVLERAGGLTPNAYLYGASFTRESARRQQQQRLDEYVSRLTQEMEHSAAQAAADGAAFGSGSMSTNIDENRVLSQLRSLRASGRIVLNLLPTDHDVASIPDIPLEDGDHLVVPPLPSSVTVIGSVYNQNSFLFEDGARVGNYLRKAGGVSRLGDGRHEFIVRADGSVVSRNTNLDSFLRSFDSLPMNPGDTVVVPEKLIKPSNLRTLLAYSSLFSSLALSAATIAILQ